MKSGAIAWIIGLVVAGGALAVVANRASESPQDRQAKLTYEQRKDQVKEQKDQVKDTTNQKKDELAEATKARMEDVKTDASRALDNLEANAERTEEKLENSAAVTQQNLDQKLDQAKDELKFSKEASEVREERTEQAAEARDEAAEARADAANANTEAVKSDQVAGTVTAINPSTRTVAIREDLSSSPTQPFRSPTQLNVDAGAKVEHAGQRLSLSDVQAGDKVILQIRDASGVRTVMNIVIQQRAAGAVAR